MYMPTVKRRVIIGARNTRRHKGRRHKHPIIEPKSKAGLKCHPAMMSKQRISDKSCISKELIDKIKPAVPNEEKIIDDCKADDKCIIDSLPRDVKAFVEKNALAPKQPDEWKENKNTWLSNFDIKHVLDQYQQAHPSFVAFEATYMDFDTKVSNQTCVSEEICNFDLAKYIADNKYQFGFVFNLARHTEKGSHWVALYIDIRDEYAFYFNSTGEKIPSEVEDLVKRIRKQAFKLRGSKLRLHTNYKYDHQEGNTECGMYALLFIITMLTGKHNDVQFKSLREKIQFFKKYKIEDDYVEKLREEYFNK